jgi:hypothetical protein
VADFGHAKGFFPDADVFPCVLVARRPDAREAPKKTNIAVIARERLRPEALVAQVKADAYDVDRATLGPEAWMLEPPDVRALLDKIRRNGVPLAEYAGVKPYRGVLTGFNEAFLIDTPTRDRLVAADPASAEIIKPYLRGQDIKRWAPDWAGLWMIFTRRGIDIQRYPAILHHLEGFRAGLEPKPVGWNAKAEWPGRKEGEYQWYEIQDSTEYYNLFKKPKIYYQEIQFYGSYAYDDSEMLGNNKTSFLQSDDRWILAILNSPMMWWHNWRYFPHMKDEALAPVGYLMQRVPIVKVSAAVIDDVTTSAVRLTKIMHDHHSALAQLLDWLRIEHNIDRPSRKAQEPFGLSSDEFVAEIRKLRGPRRPLSPASLAALRRHHAETIAPFRTHLAEAERLERRLSDLVNQAYGLTPEEIALMWRTAPPRMPLAPP